MPKPTYRIENIVATIKLRTKLDLDELARKLPATEYIPDRFPGLILRLQKPRVGALLFRTGHIVVTGARSEEELKRASSELARLLGIHEEPQAHIENIVASGSFHAEVDIEKASLLLEDTLYEPEQFPGMIYRHNEPRTVFLIFHSGHFVCTGAKRVVDVGIAVGRVFERLSGLGVLAVDYHESS